MPVYKIKISTLFYYMQHQWMYSFFEDRQNLAELDFCISFDSGKPGPTAIFFCGVHGNEVGSVDGIIQVIKLLENSELRLSQGKTVFCLANPKAVWENQRFVDQNMNRVFGIQDISGYESLRAAEISKYLTIHHKQIDLVVDLHTVSVGNFQAGCVMENQESIRFLKELIPLPNKVIFRRGDIPGMLIGYADELKITSLLVECGNHYSSLDAANLARNVILKSLEKLKITKPNQRLQIPQIKPEKTIHWQINQNFHAIPGFRWHSSQVSTGLFYPKGAEVARDDEGPILALDDSYLLIPDPNPKTGDLSIGFLAYTRTEFHE